jgi:exosortase F-associated protein
VKAPHTNLFWKNPRRITLFFAGLIALALIFVFQDVAVLNQVDMHPYLRFSLRKMVRVVINDAAMLLIIYALFNKVGITRLAWRLFLIDLLVLLPVYLLVKLTIEGDSEISSPVLSQFHRLIVNPVIMLLLIPAVYFQNLRKD